MNSNSEQSTTDLAIRPTEMSDLNDDVMREILLRLPLRPLLRSKSVSPQWYGLLAGVSLNTQLLRSTGVFTYDDSGDWGYLSRLPEDSDPYVTDLNDALDVSLRFLPCPPATVIVAAGSNGLLLCTSGAQKHANFYVCNPLTRKYCEVPRPDTSRGIRMRMHSVALDYNPKTCPNVFKIMFYRYGHARAKILRRRQYPVMRPLEMELVVFSSETGRWVTSEVTEWACASCSYTHMVSLHGVIYRLSNPDNRNPPGNGPEGANPVAVEEIRLPVTASNATYGSIGRAGGILHYSYGDEEASTVWMLREEPGQKSEWVLKYHIVMSEFVRVAARDLGPADWHDIMYQPMVFLSGHELAFLEDAGGGVVYNCDKGAFTRMETVRRLGITSARFKAFPFTPCLDDPSAMLPAARDAASTSQ